MKENIQPTGQSDFISDRELTMKSHDFLAWRIYIRSMAATQRLKVALNDSEDSFKKTSDAVNNLNSIHKKEMNNINFN